MANLAKRQPFILSSYAQSSTDHGSWTALWPKPDSSSPQIMKWRVSAGMEVQDLGAGLVDESPA
jgi:hypothetical protein